MGNAQMFAGYLHPIALGQGERALSRIGLRFRAFPASKVALFCNRPELWRHGKISGASVPLEPLPIVGNGFECAAKYHALARLFVTSSLSRRLLKLRRGEER